MIFGLGYDKNLWIILKNDKRNRNEILNFIESIPSKVFADMIKKIEDSKKNIKMVERYEFAVKDIIYFLEISKKSGFISIGSFSKKNMKDNDIWFLKLYSSLDSSEKEKICVGMFMYQKKDEYGNFDCDKVQYQILNKRKQYFVKIYDLDPFINRIKNKIDMNGIPDNVDLEDLSNLVISSKKKSLINIFNKNNKV